MQITHQTKKCWNESLKNIITYIEESTNIGADELFDKKAVKTSLMANYVKHLEHKITLEPKTRTYITFKYIFNTRII